MCFSHIRPRLWFQGNEDAPQCFLYYGAVSFSHTKFLFISCHFQEFLCIVLHLFFLLPSFVLDVLSHPWSKTCLVVFDLLPYKSPSLLLVVFPTVVTECWVTALNPDSHEENTRWFNKPLQKNLWGNKKGSMSLKLLQVLLSTGVVVWLALRLVKGQLPPCSGCSSSPSLLCYRP